MSLALAATTALLAGFISLSYEILWYRAFSYASGGPPFVFGYLLFYFLIGLAAGALASRRFCASSRGVGDPALLRRLATLVLLANLAGFVVVPALARLATTAGWQFALPLVAVAAGLWGGVLPLASHFAIAPDAESGRHASYVYVANIIGSVAGCLLTGFALMDAWSLAHIALLLVLLGLGLSAALVVLGGGTRRVPMLGLLAAAGIVSALVTEPLFDQLWERLFYQRAFNAGTRFAETVESRSGVINVSQSGEVFGGGVYDGVFSTDLVNDRNMIVRGYAVSALHPAPHEVLVVGLSGGAWAQALANMPGVERVTIVEIHPGYLPLIARHAPVASLLHNPRVEIVIDDARRWLTKHPERRFDVVVANISFHWRAHATNLLSEEWMQLVRQHLRAGGIYLFNTTDSPDAFVTAFTTFPHGLRLINFAVVSDSPIQLDLPRWRQALLAERIDGRPVLDSTSARDRGALERLLALGRTVDSTPRWMGMERGESVLKRLAGRGELVTDDNMRPEWHPAGAGSPR